MRLRNLIALAAALSLTTFAAAIPALSNVSFTQQSDGAGGTEVVVNYDLVSSNGACAVELLLSTNGGATFPISAAGATGDVGAAIAPGVGKSITWPIAAQFPAQTLASAAFLIAAEDSAASLAIANADFETDAQADGFLTLFAPTGWSTYGPIDGGQNVVGTLNSNGTTHFVPRPPGEVNCGLVFLNAPGDAEAGLQQTLGSVLESSARYRLTSLVGNIDEGTANFGYFDLTGFPGYRVDLRAGANPVASDNNTLDGTIPEGEYRTSVVEALVGAGHPGIGQALTIRLVNLDIPGTVADPGIEVDFDDIELRVAGAGSSLAGVLETVAPTAGTSTPPASASSAPFAIPFSGASDASSVASVELWYRAASGTWINSGLTVAGTSGSFNFTPPGVAPANNGDYHFDLVAEDTRGNRSPEPSGSSGTGQGTTNFDTSAGVRNWQSLGD